MKSSDRMFLESFEKNFIDFKKNEVPIILYGIGEKTKLILENVRGFNVVGLMDRNIAGGKIYGYSVLTFDEAKTKAKSIIIVANPSYLDIIAKRIAFLRDYGLTIYFANGDTPVVSNNSQIINPYFENNSEEICAQIDRHDIISFDLFDTLITRRVLMPADIFGLVEEELFYKHGARFDFKVKRIEAEYICYKTVGEFYNIFNIYDWLKEQSNISSDLLNEIYDIELLVETENCLPRKEVVSALSYAHSKNKIVIITTDTYFPKQYIASLLENCGVNRYHDLYVSCENGKSKNSGSIWRHFIEVFGEKKILHIGDNPISDIDNAQKVGIDTYEVKSASELMAISSIGFTQKYIDDVESRMLLSPFLPRLFNNPFMLHRTDGLLKITNGFNLGYLSFGPLIMNFMLRLIRSVLEKRIETILFFSRDGYLLSQLYQRIVFFLGLKAPQAIYFLTSRRAASVASISNVNDIAFVINYICNTNTSIEHVLQSALGISSSRIDKFLQNNMYAVSKDQIIKHVVRNYATEIIDNAGIEKNNYLKYVDSLNFLKNEKIACVNYVGRGVTQHCVSKIIAKDLYGYYFVTEKDMQYILPSLDKIFTVYGSLAFPYMDKSAFISKYLFGEVVLSSPDEQLLRFDDDGKPVFQSQDLKRDFTAIQECHRGVTSYIDDMLNLDRNILNRNFNSELISSLYEVFIAQPNSISDDVKNIFQFNDYYGSDQQSICLFPV